MAAIFRRGRFLQSHVETCSEFCLIVVLFPLVLCWLVILEGFSSMLLHLCYIFFLETKINILECFFVVLEVRLVLILGTLQLTFITEKKRLLQCAIISSCSVRYKSSSGEFWKCINCQKYCLC